MSTVEKVVFQGRWGFHSIDYPTFLLFKRFHLLALRDYRAGRRWQRWYAKQPENQHAVEPNGGIGTTREVYLWTLQAYRDARRPRATADEVPEFDPPRKWRTQLGELEKLYATA